MRAARILMRRALIDVSDARIDVRDAQIDVRHARIDVSDARNVMRAARTMPTTDLPNRLCSRFSGSCALILACCARTDHFSDGIGLRGRRIDAGPGLIDAINGGLEAPASRNVVTGERWMDIDGLTKDLSGRFQINSG